MKRLLAAVLSVAVPIAIFAGDNAYKVTFDGGSIADTRRGTGLKMYIEANQVRFVKDNKDLVTIPASSVTEISYGQYVHRRVRSAVAVGMVTLSVGALLALSKLKKHFVGLTWANGDQKGGLAMRATRTNTVASLLDWKA
jgi:hypothetical protein